VLKKEGMVRIPSGCAIAGIMNENGTCFNGSKIIASIENMHARSNGLGGGFAAYGIYPDLKDYYAWHMFFDDHISRKEFEHYLSKMYEIYWQEPIPCRNHSRIKEIPVIWRYFVLPKNDQRLLKQLDEDEFVAQSVMYVNAELPGCFVASSGRNMGAFKGVGYPEDIGEFYALDDYRAYIWTAHGRFPTNTPGWWGGAHPFTLLNWSVVHNGEISSYNTNQRFLEMYDYSCSLQTDTEVIVYTFDLLMRKHNLNLEQVVNVIAAPLWSDIDNMKNNSELLRLRQNYSSLLLNGPFSIIVATENGMAAINDRIKLRPLVAARRADYLYIASEESAIRSIEPELDKVWYPSGGEPVVCLLKGKKHLLEIEAVKKMIGCSA